MPFRLFTNNQIDKMFLIYVKGHSYWNDHNQSHKSYFFSFIRLLDHNNKFK